MNRVIQKYSLRSLSSFNICLDGHHILITTKWNKSFLAALYGDLLFSEIEVFSQFLMIWHLTVTQLLLQPDAACAPASCGLMTSMPQAMEVSEPSSSQFRSALWYIKCLVCLPSLASLCIYLFASFLISVCLHRSTVVWKYVKVNIQKTNDYERSTRKQQLLCFKMIDH